MAAAPIIFTVPTQSQPWSREKAPAAFYTGRQVVAENKGGKHLFAAHSSLLGCGDGCGEPWCRSRDREYSCRPRPVRPVQSHRTLPLRNLPWRQLWAGTFFPCTRMVLSLFPPPLLYQIIHNGAAGGIRPGHKTTKNVYNPIPGIIHCAPVKGIKGEFQVCSLLTGGQHSSCTSSAASLHGRAFIPRLCDSNRIVVSALLIPATSVSALSFRQE